MRTKYFFVFISLVIKLVDSKSFTIVLDTTVSMQDEIDVIRINMPALVDIMKNTKEFQEFSVVPFNDPDVGPPIISSNPDSLVEYFNGISASDGADCPEDSLAGIHMALENSKPNSIVYVFTDAYAKDVTRFKDIENLCKNTRSQVVIFLSGSCSEADSGTPGYVDIYYDIAKACSGAVLKYDSYNLRKAFSYIREMISTDWNDIVSHEAFTGYKQLPINIDSFTSDFLIAVSGDYPTLRIVDFNERSLELQKIVDTRQSLVVRIRNLRPGRYQATINCQGVTSLTFYKKSRVPYQYGFSTRRPRSIKETSLRPMPAITNFMLIVIPEDFDLKISAMELQMNDGGNRTLLSIEESQTQKGFYTTSLLVKPSVSFKILIYGMDSSYNEATITTNTIEPQVPVMNAAWSKPVVEILDDDNNLINFGTNGIMVCKVMGYPKPRIVWEDEQNKQLTSEDILLEVPSVYLSYVSLNVTANQTLSCKADNKEGYDERYLHLFVNRTFSFDVIQRPNSQSFEFGSEGKLYCEVNAYPEAEIKWLYNGTSIEYNNNIEVVDYENALVIKNMTINDVGVYTCKASNYIRTENLKADIGISGLEAPELDVKNSVVDLKPGDDINIECRIVKGNPAPKITWQYQLPDGYDFDSVPTGVFTKGGNLKISSAEKDHKGTYKCLATNMLGEDYKEISVNIKYAPIISDSEHATLSVKEGDTVELPCEVDATPEATVQWAVGQDDVLINSDSRHAIDGHHTLRFSALRNESGIYHCIAENEVGRTEKTVTVNVLVAPYIQPEMTVVNVYSGANVTLPCVILDGNPAPTSKWEFIAKDYTTSVKSRGRSQTAHLYLNNVSRADEGMYLCIAENDIGNDRIRMDLKVN